MKNVTVKVEYMRIIAEAIGGGAMEFDEARAVFIEGASGLLRNAGLLNKAISTLPRHLIFGFAVRVYAQHIFDPSAPELTLTRLQKLSGDHGGISAGRVTAQVHLLRKLGLITTRAGEDRRERLLEPTEKMLIEDHRWLMTRFEPLGPLGLFHLTEEERTTPEFALAFRVAWTIRSDQIAAFSERYPSIAFFFMHDGGYSMLLELLREWQTTGSNRVAFDVMATASAFCVSKSQIWSLLHGARNLGLISAEAPAWRSIILSERLLTDFDAWFNDIMVGFAAMATRSRLLWTDYRQK